jgi:hypothetical protein
MSHDSLCARSLAKGPGSAVAWVLMASYLYYHRDESLLSDHMYDRLTSLVREQWDRIRHPHRDILAPLRESQSSTLFDLHVTDYPAMARSAACRLLGIPEQLESEAAYG